MTISELGRGAYGVVEKVRHTQSGTILAVKVSREPCQEVLGHRRLPGVGLSLPSPHMRDGGEEGARLLLRGPLPTAVSPAADPGHRELPGAEASAYGLGCEHAHG